MFEATTIHIVIIVVFLVLIIALEAFNLWVLFRVPTGDTATCNSSIDYTAVRRARIISVTLIVVLVLTLVLLLYGVYRRRQLSILIATSGGARVGGAGVVRTERSQDRADRLRSAETAMKDAGDSFDEIAESTSYRE